MTGLAVAAINLVTRDLGGTLVDDGALAAEDGALVVADAGAFIVVVDGSFGRALDAGDVALAAVVAGALAAGDATLAAVVAGALAAGVM